MIGVQFVVLPLEFPCLRIFRLLLVRGFGLLC